MDDTPHKNLWEVRKADPNNMMSLKGDGKPVSFIEDCAVSLVHLAKCTDALTNVFREHGSKDTWHHLLPSLRETKSFLVVDRGGPDVNLDEFSLDLHQIWISEAG